MLVAAALRFWKLGDIPPGLYRDEAFNGLDALAILDGQHALYFSANNGREPAYIYLVALFIPLLGRTAAAVRIIAAITGTLTTWVTYRLASDWFDRRTGLLAAWLFAVTLWPLHLSRIGLRAILLPLMLGLTFWLAGRAYVAPQSRPQQWLLAGLVYGAAFYTYLAIRFTPLLILILVAYLLWQERARPRRRSLWPGLLWFAAGTALALLPLIVLFVRHPDLLFGRAGQVSILNPAINEGNLWRTAGQQIMAALGMFFVRGDTILRHNPAARPIFDLLMTIPFLLGVIWCLRQWRRPAAAALLLWTAVMLGPTILAEDTPHFLRAAGILPAVMIFPAIGLSQLWSWPKLPPYWRQAAVLALAGGTLFLTVRDYFTSYARQPETAYLFETAARELAGQINNDLEKAPPAAVFVDSRFTSGYPSLRFLIEERIEDDEAPLKRRTDGVRQFQPAAGLPYQPEAPFVIYLWPYGPRDFVASTAAAVTFGERPLLISAESGPLARGDLETQAYPLFVRYAFVPAPDRLTGAAVVADFDNQMQLRETQITVLDDKQLQVDLYWSTEQGLDQDTVVFIHVTGPDGIIGQSDIRPAEGQWPWSRWQSGQILYDRHIIALRDSYDQSRQQIIVGLYDADSGMRLPLRDAAGAAIGDTWPISR